MIETDIPKKKMLPMFIEYFKKNKTGIHGAKQTTRFVSYLKKKGHRAKIIESDYDVSFADTGLFHRV